MIIYVMSIKKEYGINLLELKSSWEYRRRKSKIEIGDKIVLYAIAPDRELIGEFVVGNILTGTSRELWEKTKEDVCYKKDEVISYLELGNFPIAFRVSNPIVYSSPATKVDEFLARSSREAYVSVEKIVDEVRNPTISGLYVAGIIHSPGGSAPTSLYPQNDVDSVAMELYGQGSRERDLRYCKEVIRNAIERRREN